MRCSWTKAPLIAPQSSTWSRQSVWIRAIRQGGRQTLPPICRLWCHRWTETPPTRSQIWLKLCFKTTLRTGRLLTSRSFNSSPPRQLPRIMRRCFHQYWAIWCSISATPTRSRCLTSKTTSCLLLGHLISLAGSSQLSINHTERHSTFTSKLLNIHLCLEETQLPMNLSSLKWLRATRVTEPQETVLLKWNH